MKTKYLEITASRWPWQGYGWFRSSRTKAPFNSKGSRFGGGWDYCLGVEISVGEGYSTWLFNLLFGIIKIKFRTPNYYD